MILGKISCFGAKDHSRHEFTLFCCDFVYSVICVLIYVMVNRALLLQIILLLLALIAVPWMLFPKPFILKKIHTEVLWYNLCSSCCSKWNPVYEIIWSQKKIDKFSFRESSKKTSKGMKVTKNLIRCFLLFVNIWNKNWISVISSTRFYGLSLFI